IRDFHVTGVQTCALPILDGVPGFNGFQGIKPKQSFTYRFKVRQNGTYCYHAHSKGQEQDGLYGALVIYPKAQTPMPEHEKTEREIGRASWRVREYMHVVL